MVAGLRGLVRPGAEDHLLDEGVPPGIVALVRIVVVANLRELACEVVQPAGRVAIQQPWPSPGIVNLEER